MVAFSSAEHLARCKRQIYCQESAGQTEGIKKMISIRQGSIVVTMLISLLSAGCTGLAIDYSDNAAGSQGTEPPVTPITAALLTQMAAEQQDPVRVVSPLVTSFSTDTTNHRYRVGRGDRLVIAVPALASLSAAGTPTVGQVTAQTESGNAYTVGDDGTIYLPFVGFLKVEGQTVRELQESVINKLSQYIRAPQVLVSVQEFSSQRVIVTGAVPKPGYLPITNLPLTVMDTMVATGAINMPSSSAAYPTALSSNSGQNVIRADYPDLENVLIRRGSGSQQINIARMLSLGDLSQNIVLQAGDAVQVNPLNRTHIYLLGEVNQQALVEILDRRTSLAQVIASAGGFKQTSANTRRVYIIRGGLKLPSIYQLDGEQPEALLLADAFRLQERDVIYVAEAKISQWNRFLSQLVPSLQTLLTGSVFVNATK